MTGYLRNYVPWYAYVSKPLQDRKTELLKRGPVKGAARKMFAAREAFAYPTGAERAAFTALQKALSSPTVLVHFNILRALFIDLDSSKERGFGAIAYHVKQSSSSRLRRN